MAQMTPEVSKLLEQALSLSLDEQEALANSLISNLGESVGDEVRAAWDSEIKRRMDEIRSGKVEMIPEAEVRRRIADRLRNAQR
jgi:putative addiction module component (TIGR02574 family)